MKKLVILFVAVCATVTLYSQKVVKVSTALELLNAIKPNTTIELAPGVYNLSQVAEEVDNDHVVWVDNYDGLEPDIYEVSDLTIKGAGKATILLEPRYAWVMMFYDCTNITFDGITFGHTESGYCMGGVLGFESCYNVNILNCSLYGSGTVGIMANMCAFVVVKNSDIYECSYGLAYIYSCNGVSFIGTKFRKTGEYNLVEIMSSSDVSFVKCSFTDNFTNEYMPHLFSIDENIWSGYAETESEKSKNVLISKCTFKNNQITSFVNNDENLSVEKCKFSNNLFDN